MTHGISRRDFVALTGLGLAGALCPRLFATDTLPAGRQPNFILILGEAQGWTSTSIQMDDTYPASKSTLFHTPNLELLAKDGIRFADSYAPSPRCTPSRAALLTGKSPAQLHMTFISERGVDLNDPSRKLLTSRDIVELPAAEITIADLLKKAGYATAHFGKWHVGRVSPASHGFDETDGPNDNNGPDRSGHPNPKEAFALTDHGLDFMSRQAKAGKPFYLQLSHYPGRDPADALGKTYEMWLKEHPRTREQQLAAAAINQDMDTTIGLVLKKIDELGIADHTYVIYTADHGSPGRNANLPLANGKGTLWEGGIRIPLILRGPGIKPGACSHTRVTSLDLFPTLAQLAISPEPLPKGLEGASLVPLLTKDPQAPIQRPREEFVFHYPHYDYDYDGAGPASAIILGNYKLIRFWETSHVDLFDISKDVVERHDLATEMPDKVAQLERRLDDYLKTINAQLPVPNPNYRPPKSSASQPATTRAAVPAPPLSPVPH